MTTLLRRSLLAVILTLIALLSGEALAQNNSTPAPPDKLIKKATRKKIARKSARRRAARRVVRRGALKRRIVKPQLTTGVAPAVAPLGAPGLGAPGKAQSPADAPAALTIAVEQARYAFAGYIAAEDGSPIRVWHSREYTVRSPYAYLGRMKFGETWQHVWAETSGTLLASAVTETTAEPMPDIAQMMERFPDGGAGVVVAGWDDFPPPAEPSVEVVELGDAQPGLTR
ncbi:MAG: hypothetical protein CFK52_13650 [Chloracidobacterium sp. CP2_5A]|nr:MAG: hypothetical protein CFK52_13650 [Chloracidobacterium sp. CP2_5A]